MESGFNDISKSKNQDADCFNSLISEKGFNFASGVPCGVLKYFISNFDVDDRFMHVRAQNEPESVGIAAGAYLAGKKPVLYMQNSGLFKSINEIGSLLLPYSIPALFIVTYRGCKGENAPQHMINGKITKPILEDMGLPYFELRSETIDDTVKSACRNMENNNIPSVILVKRGWTNKKRNMLGEVSLRKNKIYDNDRNKINRLIYKKTELFREEAIDTVIDEVNYRDAVFSTTGLISRSIFERYDSDNFFYNTGSFGMVSSEGLGFSMSRPEIRTYIIDGDASLLTNLGCLVTIGGYKPKNLIHIVLDNKSYASCSEEESFSKAYNLSEVASVNGYNELFAVNSTSGLKEALRSCKAGPSFIQANLNLGGRRDFKRPMDLEYISSRFKQFFQKDD